MVSLPPRGPRSARFRAGLPLAARGRSHATALARERFDPESAGASAARAFTNALGCRGVADLGATISCGTINRPVTGGVESATIKAVLEELGGGRPGPDRQGGGSAAACRIACIQPTCSSGGPDAHHQRAAASVDVYKAKKLQALFETAYFARFRVELKEIRANLVNSSTLP